MSCTLENLKYSLINYSNKSKSQATSLLAKKKKNREKPHHKASMIVQFSYWNDTLRFWGNVCQGPLFRLALKGTGQPLACFYSSGTSLSASPPLPATVLRPSTSWAPSCPEIYCPNLCNQTS